ncbi:hypothetical protein NKI95_32850 [Mesorhizobium sp. M0306]|uniref:hypothetical protein n=1 Tax=Mesorhizobium sp. M0306 TaxID=2956932 RepID=UPI003339A9FF
MSRLVCDYQGFYYSFLPHSVSFAALFEEMHRFGCQFRRMLPDRSNAVGEEAQRLVDIAARFGTPSVVAADPSLDRFLSGLRMAWKEGEIRPTAQAKPKQKRGRAIS